MASEKAIYWLAVAVLGAAAMNGFVSEYRDRASRLADTSVAMVEQASEIVAGYANLAMPQGHENDGFKRLVRAQVRLARVRSTVARQQAEMARAQVEGIRAQITGHGMRGASPAQGRALFLMSPGLLRYLRRQLRVTRFEPEPNGPQCVTAKRRPGPSCAKLTNFSYLSFPKAVIVFLLSGSPTTIDLS